MKISDYINKLNTRYKSGITTEHSFRGDLQTYLETLLPGIMVTNEPTRISCGAPDYILTSKSIPVGYIEAKDMGADLYSKSYDEQFIRYRNSLENLIITNYIDFHFFRNGEPTFQISIAKTEKDKITAISDQFTEFENRIKDFSTVTGQTIKSSEKLAKMMASKARLLASVIENALSIDESEGESKLNEGANNSLREQLAGFKQVLIHDIEPKEFADIYAQTIAYGMFAARLHDPSLQTFTRKEAAELIPKSNPFLRKLFQYIAGYDLDPRITWIVDSLADIFRATDVNALLKNFGKSTQQHDPIIHFYETFLSEYDPKLRKARGVWYTPEPVVKFIVRAVDDILKTEFNLPDGLADTSKTKIKVKVPTHDKRYASGQRDYEQEVHKVQILDPATGTGTFLAEVIKHIYKEKFEGQQGIWSSYVENHLIPRLNGFELLMASYAMAHLKLDMLLTETGYMATKDQRLRVYLTNSLEEYHPETGTLFANWLSGEANEANQIKRDVPVMVVIGNPPYSVSSTNKNHWIDNLINDYKKQLNEKSYNSLSDDYVKFIRFGQHFIEKNGSGILAFITNNSFVDGIVFRQMRKNLLNCFDKTYILNLHGNAKKKEVCPDGSIDQNIFDIMQGVSINIFIKTGIKKTESLGRIYQTSLQGKRQFKYDFLHTQNLKTITWKELDNKAPQYFFIDKDYAGESDYNEGFAIDDLFVLKAAGIKTHRDAVVIGFDQNELKSQVEKYLNLNQTLVKKFDISKCKPISYRPFDNRIIYYDTDLVERHRQEQIKHSFQENDSLILGRQTKNEGVNHFFVTKTLSEMKTAESSTGSYHFQLFIYPENNQKQHMLSSNSLNFIPNLNHKIIKHISSILKIGFNSESNHSSILKSKTSFSSLDILDYIYATLYSNSYRNKYNSFLRIDFPKIPYPKEIDVFYKLTNLGFELRQLHLLESPLVSKFITKYSVNGSNEVDKIRYKDGKVWINETQYFSGVPEIAWNFYIGGYQPAQKWLKDRKGRQLSFEDIQHYQKIIVALTETDRIMKEIDKIDFI